MGHRTIAIGSVVVCAAVAVAAVASTSGGTPSPVALAHAFFFDGYQLSADHAGAATVVFSEQKMVRGTALQGVYVREQIAAGGWDTPRQLGMPAQYSTPSLAEAGSGAAVIVLAVIRQSPSAPSQLESVVESFTRASATARWSGPFVLWTGTGLMSFDSPPAVQVDAAGLATVVWSDGASAHPAIWTSTVDPRVGIATRATQLVGAGGGGTDLRLAANPAGAAVVSWEHQDSRSTGIPGDVHASEMAMYRTAAGSWTSPQRLDRFSIGGVGGGAEVWAPASPSIAVAANGDATAAWIAGPGGNTGTPLMAAGYNAKTGRWTAPHVLSAEPEAFAVASAGKNSFVAVWDTGRRATVMTATTRNGAGWSSARRLPGYTGTGDLSEYLAGDRAGSVTLTMSGRRSAIVYLTRKPDGTWTSIKKVGTGIFPEVAVTSSPSTTLVWEQVSRGGDLLETRAAR